MCKVIYSNKIENIFQFGIAKNGSLDLYELYLSKPSLMLNNINGNKILEISNCLIGVQASYYSTAGFSGNIYWRRNMLSFTLPSIRKNIIVI